RGDPLEDHLLARMSGHRSAVGLEGVVRREPMKWLMRQGPAIRSTRARSWVTHFIGVLRPAHRALFRPLRLLAVGQLERGFQSLGELDRIVIGPEVHVE